LLAAVAALGATGVLGYVGVVPNMGTGWAALALLLWMWTEYQIADGARRDHLTDLSQAVHDGAVDGDDLRRSRGYREVEQMLGGQD
jgi:hypothetical protein